MCMVFVSVNTAVLHTELVINTEYDLSYPTILLPVTSLVNYHLLLLDSFFSIDGQFFPLDNFKWQCINSHVRTRFNALEISLRDTAPRLRCLPEVNSDDTVADEINPWSEHPRPKCPLIRRKCARNTGCARSALEMVCNQTFPDGKDLRSDQNQTILQTLVRPWRTPNTEHQPDHCALKITSDQTIVRSKSLLIRLNCTQNSLITEWFSLWTNFVIIY